MAGGGLLPHHHHHSSSSSSLEDGFYPNTDPSSTNASNNCYGCNHMSLVSLTVISIICLLLIFFRNSVKDLLIWLETTDAIVSYMAFLCMFVLVSFPVAWGYFLLLLTTGYVYGFLRGVLVVLSCGAIGVTVAYLVLRNCCRSITMSFYTKRIEAVIKVVEGNQGYKVIALARLTPIPFGLQNGLFGLTHVSVPVYVIASVVGMTPLALVNCYIGSTFRSMEEIWSDSSSHATGYLVFIGQLLLMFALMTFVIRKAREELRRTVMTKCLQDNDDDDDNDCYCNSRHHHHPHHHHHYNEENNSKFFTNLSSNENSYIDIPCSVCMKNSHHNSVFTA